MKNKDEQHFVVLFIPEVQVGFTELELRLNIKRLFNLDDVKLDALFQGKPSIIKSGADEETAALYKRAIERNGGSCWVEPEQYIESGLLTA